MDSLAAKARQLPKKVYAAAKNKALTTYGKLKSRYGRGLAIAIMAAGVAGLPLPVPGSSLITAAPVLVLAELVKKFRGTPVTQKALTPEQVKKLGKQVVEQLLRDWAAEHPEAGRKCLEGTPAPGPCPRNGQEDAGHSERQKKVAAALGGVIDRASGLSDAQKADYKGAISKVVGNMTPKALQRFAGNVKRVRFHGSTRELTKAIMAEDPEVRDRLQGGKYEIKGAYDGKTRQLDLDGPTKLEGKSYGTDHPIAHELSHALDGPGHEISKSKEWQGAWQAEIKTGALSKYGATSPSEGFAEFGRLYLSSGEPDIEKKFPKCVAVWKSHGLL